MSDVNTPDVERPGFDRRTLIKRAAATGAIAWAAPVIIDSLASPAAALTCADTCFRTQFPGADPCGGNVSQQPSTNCPTTGCSSTTDVLGGQSFSQVCISPPADCSPSTSPVTFQQLTPCTWGASGSTCNPARRFVAAQAQIVNTATDEFSCIAGVVSPNGDSVTFTLPANSAWIFFQFLISCSCG